MVHQLLALLCLFFPPCSHGDQHLPCPEALKSDDPTTLPKLINFCCELAWQMIDNEFARKDDIRANLEAVVGPNAIHKLAVAPVHAKYFNGCRWILGAKYKYQAYKCHGLNCKSHTRNYCICTPSVWMCSECHVKHAVDCALAA